ncbi:hypothetical protein HDV00_001393 [Rhizophlyctis rosea]|nr:hypothetical protein HDV00_001393 [Rhizophlyctis rosea]
MSVAMEGVEMKDWPGRWRDVYTYLERPGPFAQPGYEPGEDVKDVLHEKKILVIGAGGLGCELLKDLALVGFKDIHVIDMDTIDISNLNRQFLFRQADVGRPKAEVAAEFIMKRIPGVTVTPYFGKIQDKDEDYYSQFTIIICGLDSVEARRWINATVVGMFDPEDPETLIPIIDGGTEGFKGQSRIIIPSITACYECSLDMQTKPTTFPMCTIANTPRLPEHCIEWASVLQWPKAFPEKKLDGDDPEHIKWLLETAQSRASEFNIPGVTYSLTQGVVKNIIPAIASTNAIVAGESHRDPAVQTSLVPNILRTDDAAACANEALKVVTACANYVNNYMLYTGDHGVYTHTFALEKSDECPVCGGEAAVTLTVSKDMTLQELLDILLENQRTQLKRPSLRTATKSLFMRGVLERQTRANLSKTVSELVDEGEPITVTDENLPISMTLLLKWS